MNWKGYVQILPTDDQVKRLEQAIKRADDFLKDSSARVSVINKHRRHKRKRVLFFWEFVTDVIDHKEINKDPEKPYGVVFGAAKIVRGNVVEDFKPSNNCKIMQDIQQMIQAGSPLYLDNEMVKVWNKVQETIHDTQRFPKRISHVAGEV